MHREKLAHYTKQMPEHIRLRSLLQLQREEAPGQNPEQPCSYGLSIAPERYDSGHGIPSTRARGAPCLSRHRSPRAREAREPKTPHSSDPFPIGKESNERIQWKVVKGTIKKYSEGMSQPHWHFTSSFINSYPNQNVPSKQFSCLKRKNGSNHNSAIAEWMTDNSNNPAWVRRAVVPDNVVVRPNPLLMAAEQIDGTYVLPSAITQVFPKPCTGLKFCFWT